MKINLDRLCKLAGVESTQDTQLNEASNSSLRDDPALSGEAEHRFGQNQLAEDSESEDDSEEEEEKEEMAGHGTGAMEENLDEIIEVDEAMLVQELRRAKAMISEARKASEAEKTDLSEIQLRDIVADEVSNIMKDFNLTAGWVYGDSKPKNSKRGQVITSMPGLGFKNFGK